MIDLSITASTPQETLISPIAQLAAIVANDQMSNITFTYALEINTTHNEKDSPLRYFVRA